ncbi:hypothetical protein GQ600_15009 [Phytophthora cactorum]|nr:hypothetical protein GQ600_15009 [Phytophthora cactorum]
MRMGHFGLGTLLALIILIATTEAVIAVNTITKDMATDSRVIPRQLSDLTADEEERCGRRSQCDPWWGNFKAWFKKTFTSGGAMKRQIDFTINKAKLEHLYVDRSPVHSMVQDCTAGIRNKHAPASSSATSSRKTAPTAAFGYGAQAVIQSQTPYIDNLCSVLRYVQPIDTSKWLRLKSSDASLIRRVPERVNDSYASIDQVFE